jgi:hypothetical protein
VSTDTKEQSVSHNIIILAYWSIVRTPRYGRGQCSQTSSGWPQRQGMLPLLLKLKIYRNNHTRRRLVKVILLADSIRSRLLSWFGSPIIKKIAEYHLLNVYGYVEI